MDLSEMYLYPQYCKECGQDLVGELGHQCSIKFNTPVLDSIFVTLEEKIQLINNKIDQLELRLDALIEEIEKSSTIYDQGNKKL